MWKKFFAVMALGITGSGCSIIGDPVVDKIADGARLYCREPLHARQVVAHSVNAKLTADEISVDVDCKGDPED